MATSNSNDKVIAVSLDDWAISPVTEEVKPKADLKVEAKA